MKLHTQRWITGIVVVPPLVALILYGSSLLFSIVITLVIIRGVFEYNTMIFKDKKYLEKTEGLIVGLCIPLAAFMGGVPLMSATAAFSLIVVFLIFLMRMKQERADFTSLSKVVFGFMYVPFLMSHLILLRTPKPGSPGSFLSSSPPFWATSPPFTLGGPWGRTS
jgi:phosphatidate cytidylyltransferase